MTCFAFMKGSMCFKSYFCFTQLFPLQFEDFFFVVVVFSSHLDIKLLKGPFLPVKRTLTLREGNSCQPKAVQMALAVMLHTKHTAKSLLGTAVLRVAEFITNRTTNNLSTLL